MLLLCTDGLTDSIDSGNRKQIWDRYDNILERLNGYQKLVKDLMFYDYMSVIIPKIC